VRVAKERRLRRKRRKARKVAHAAVAAAMAKATAEHGSISWPRAAQEEVLAALNGLRRLQGRGPITLKPEAAQ